MGASLDSLVTASTGDQPVVPSTAAVIASSPETGAKWSDGRAIVLNNDPQDVQVHTVLSVLARAHVYRSPDHRLVTPSHDGSRIVRLSRPIVAVLIEKFIAFVKAVPEKLAKDGTVLREEGLMAVPPARAVVDAVFERGDYPELRLLLGVRALPYVGPYGVIVSEPGYSEESGIYLRPPKGHGS